MNYIGNVHHKLETDLGTLACVVSGPYLICKLTVGDTEVLRVPLSASAAKSEIEVRLTNIINQTGLVSNPVRVVLNEDPE